MSMSQSSAVRLLVGALGLVGVLAGPAFPDPPHWHRVVIESGEVGEDQCAAWCVLRFDPAGNPTIAYLDPNQRQILARPNPSDPNGVDGDWIKEEVPQPEPEGIIVGRTALEYDPSGNAALAYSYLPDPNNLMITKVIIARGSFGGWGLTERTPGFLPTDRGRIRLGFDASGHVHVVYPWAAPLAMRGVYHGMVPQLDPNDVNDPNWYSVVATVIHFDLRDMDPDFVFDPQGYPRVVYGNCWGSNQETFYCTYDPNNPGDPCGLDFWSKEVVFDASMFDTRLVGPSLRFDGADQATIAAYLWDGAIPSEGRLVWLVKEGYEDWPMSDIAGDIGRGSPHRPDLWLEYRGDGNPGVSYRSDSVSKVAALMYAWLDPSDANDTDPNLPHGVWQRRKVDGRPAGGQSDKGADHCMAIDPNGMPAIVYYDVTWNCLRYAVVADEPDTYTLSTWNEGLGHSHWGTIEIDPGLAEYPEGTLVSLTAVPSQDKRFVTWKVYDPRYPGDANYARQDSNNPLQLVIEYDTQVGAVFDCARGDALLPAILGVMGMTLAVAKLNHARRRNRAGR